MEVLPEKRGKQVEVGSGKERKQNKSEVAGKASGKL